MGSSCSSEKSVTTTDPVSDKGDKKILQINEAKAAVNPTPQLLQQQKEVMKAPQLLSERSRESSTMSSSNLHPLNNNNNNNSFLKDSSDIEDDTKSIGSISSERSRPPTPFSRPLTARIAQRPRTTTIFERESDQVKLQRQLAQEQQKANGGGGSCASSQCGDAGGGDAREHHGFLGGHGHHRDEGYPPGSGRRASRQMSAADQEDIVKLKEFLSQKGL